MTKRPKNQAKPRPPKAVAKRKRTVLPPAPHTHQQRFNQLLDDAILGVKKSKKK